MGVRARFNKSTGDMLAECELATKIDPKQRRANRTGAARDSSQSKKHTSSLGYLTRAPRERQKFVKLSIDSSDEERTREDEEDDESEDGQDSEKEEEEAHWNGKPLLELKLEEDVASRAESKQQEDFYSDPKVARHKSWASCKLLDMSLTGDTALFKCDSFSLFNKHRAASEISDKRRRKTDKMMRAVQNCYVWPDNNKMGRKGSDSDDDEQDEEWRANNRVHNCSATLKRKEAIKAAAESQIESAPPSEPSNWRRSIEQAQRHAGQQRHRLGVSSPVLHETVSAEHEGRHYVTSAGCAAARPDLLCKSAASVASLSCAGGQQHRPDLSDGPCELANSGQGQIGGQAAARPADDDQRHSSGRRKRPDAPVAGRDECSLDQLGGADDDETLESNCFLSSRANCRAGEPMDTGGVPLAQARRHRHDGRHSRSHGDDVGHGYDKVHSHASIESAEAAAAAAANLLQLSSAAVHNGRAAESDNDGHHYCPTFGSYASKLDARATQSGAAPAPGPPPDAGVHHLQRQGQQYGLDTGSTGLEGGSTRQAALVGQQQQQQRQQANLAECQAASALSWAGGEKSAANENNGQASTGLQQQSALVKPVAGSTALATAPATANKLHPVSSLTPCGTNSSSARKPIIGGQTELAPPSWSRQQQLAKAATAGGGGAPGQQSAANTHLEQKYAAAVARGGHVASRYCDRSGADADGCSWRKQSAKSGQMASEQSHGGQDEGKQVVMKLTSSKTARQAAVLKISGEADGKQQESGSTTVSSAGKLIGIDLNNVASRLVDTCASSWRLQASLLAGGSHTGSYKVAQIHNKQQQQERHREQAQRESQQRIAPTETAMALASTTSSSDREARGQRQQNWPRHLLAAGDQSWTGRLRRDEGSSNQEAGRNCDSGVAAPAASRLSRPGRSPASLRRQTNARITRHRLKIQQQRQEQLANLALGERKQTYQQQLTNNNLNNNNCQQVSASSSSSRGIASRSANRSGSFHPVSSHQQQQHLRPGPSEPAHIEIEILQSTPDDQRRQQRQYQESSAARSPSSISSSFSYFKSLLSRGLPSLGQSSSRSARLSLNTASPAGRLALTSLGPDCRRSTRLQTTARPINPLHDQPTPSSSATCSIIEIDSRRQQQQQQRNRTSQRLRKHPNRREIRALTAEHLASANVIVYRSAADMLQSGQASGGTSQRVGGQQQAGSNFRGQYQERQSASVVSKTQHLSGRTNSTSTSNNSSANLEPLKRQLHDDDDQSSAASTASSTLSLSNRPFCKICHLTSSKNGDKLISPCKCSGTMRYIHCSCLLKWLEISNRTNEKQPMSCELCSHEYTWHKRFNLHQMKLPKCSIKDIILHTIFVLSLGVMMFCALAPLFYQRNNADSLIGQRQTDNKFAPPPTLQQLGDEPIKTRTALTFDRGNNYNDNNIPTDHSLTTSGSNANSRRSQFKVSASLSSSAHHHLNGLATSVSSPRGAAANQLASDEKFILFCAAFFFISFFIAIYAQTKARDTLYGLIVKFANMNLTYYIKEYDHEQQYNGTNGNKTDHYNTPYTSDDQDHRSTLIDAGGQNTTSNSTHQQPSQGTVQGAASHHHKRPQQQAHKMMG